MKHQLAAVLLFCLWGVVAVILCTPAAPNSGGVAHPQIEKMDQGGAGVRHGQVLVLGWMFGTLLIAGFVGLLTLGTVTPQANSPGGSSPTAERRAAIQKRAAFIGCGLIFVAVFTIMCVAYARAYADPLSEPFWGPFPTSTSWLVFVLWPIPALFIVLYVVCFDTWIAPPHHIEQFEAVVREYRSDQ
jgi:amino acid transporter